ncbi:uncharacterized protein J4E79_010681 [Alternaria viburni]|uniref:uncharacterized protein n=1 Tax=Alternaria viburni TaxID=566460 RepID=UPI0020C2393D|nr:uncharacterized protein J4E79_010681 [Alternaria viburni]KAI4646172.1 hypothetical protein J4E79_010681 [Alternaria viburni]
MRSQIACTRCRRSKTKCENTGQGTTCKACANTNRDCTWDHAAVASSTGSVRRDSTADFDAPPKKRRKLLAPTSTTAQRSVEGLGSPEDALQSPLLTSQVWEELFDIYEKHFSTDFPFLHKRTFLSSVRPPPSSGSSSEVKTPTQAPTPRVYAPLLLAFLTQTARFHDKLVAQMGNDPIRVAEFYASATRTQMGTDIIGSPNVEKIQTLLMLGYYEWTNLQGTEGWMKVGIAIRAAICLGYPHLDVDESGLPAPLKDCEKGLSEKDQFILRETQRRTFWSCVLMDCYLSWGEDRPRMLTPDQLQRTQLVCSDGAFNFGKRARTRLLGEDDAMYTARRKRWNKHAEERRNDHDGADRASALDGGRWEVAEGEAELTWYIKVVVIFGEVSQWSCKRGRRQEGKNPPWCATTGFKKLEDKLKQLKRDLPDHLQLTSDNNDDRSYNSPGKYVAIHAMYTLCFVWLYREYMPTSPWTLTYPRGPLDEPLIDEKPPDPDYWIKQAKDSIYCHYFPHMDPDDALSSRKDPRAHDIANGFLLRILSRFKMARSWLSQLAEWQRYYRREKKKYRELSGQIDDSPKSNSSDGVASGGLKDYAQLFERTHKQFGDIANANDNDGQWPDRDKDLADTRLPHDEDSAERTLPTSAASVKHEMQGAPEEKSSNQSGFTAVNHNGQQTPPAPPPVTQPSTYAHGGRTPSYDQNSHMRATVPVSPAHPYQPYPYPNTQQQPLRSPFQQSDPRQSPVSATASVPIHSVYQPWPQARPQELQEQKVNMEICGAATFPNGWAGDVMIGDSAQDFNNWGQYGFPTIPDNSGYYQSGYSYPPQ